MKPKIGKYKSLRLSLAVLLFLSAATYPAHAVEDYKGKPLDVDAIVKGIISVRHPTTKLSPSHWGHPGYENLAFLYDKSVDAIVLKAAGYQTEAEEILDYFAARLEIPLAEIVANLDTNGIYGLLKPINRKAPSQGSIKTLINSMDISSSRRQGRGQLEFWTTPGPVSFLILAFLTTNVEKYKDKALILGDVLLTMQRDDDGGISDGDRAPNRVHTEPHNDAYAALEMLYQVTGDKKWKEAADRAFSWFVKNVYHPAEGIIDQGAWEGQRSTIFAEDVYAWCMAGPTGDRIPLEELKKLTHTMLRQSLVRIKVALPDSTSPTIVLSDFTNPAEPEIKKLRGGFHPLGSMEWTGGSILALQKNAVRAWQANDASAARFYKSIAEYLMVQISNCFYTVNDLRGKMTFYATGQGIQVAPFGSIRSGLSEGWTTPFFYSKTSDGKAFIKGGATVGAWPLLPYLGVNPFILNDPYKKIYDKIPLTREDKVAASSYVGDITKDRYFEEPLIIRAPYAGTQIIEPEKFNREMLRALSEGHFKDAIKWARMTLSNPIWVEYAKRDNLLKKHEIGGIIRYPWGTAYPDNRHPLHNAIMRYPLLNEVALAMWGMASAYYELGDHDTAKYWMERIIDDVPFHQIADTQEGLRSTRTGTIIGYWNALVSWEDSPGGNPRDEKMRPLYREVLNEKGLSTAKPTTVEL